jgi:predicted nucleic acid-binding protein
MNADRIFLDANILFSIAYGSLGLNRLRELAKKKRCVLFASNYVAEEAKRNLFSSEQLRNLEAFLSMVQLVPDVDPTIPCPIELPEKDRPVLLAAISIKANYLLTGDMIHFGRYFGQTVGGIRICPPRDYLMDKIKS